MTELGEFAMWIAVGGGMVAFWLTVSPVFKAIAGRIERKGQPGLSDLEQRIQALEDKRVTAENLVPAEHRLSELEERMDFAERLLAPHRVAPEESPPQGVPAR